MTLKEKIQSDYIQAMKAKDVNVKSALNSIKAQITVVEKANANQPLDDVQTLKVLTSAIKQRKQSIEAFQLAGRVELVEKENAEMKILESYLPKQMTDSEIESEVRLLMQSFPEVSTNRNALIGKTMGAFTKQFPGQAEPQKVKAIIESLV